MQIGMRQVSAETMEWFGTACNGGALARGLCERESRLGQAGRLCLASARKILPKLAERLGARLPEAEALELDPRARPAPDFPDSSVACTLRELGALSLVPVADAEDRPPLGGDDREPSSGGVAPPAGRAGQALDPLRACRCSGRHRLRGGRDPARAARRRRRLVGRRPRGQHRQGRVQQPLPAASRRPGEGPRLPGAAPGRGPDCRRLGGGARRSPGARADLHRAGAVRPELPGGGVEVLPGADLGAAFGRAARGLAQAAGGGLAAGPAARAGAGSRLVRLDACRGGMGRAGMRPEHASRRPGQAPDRADGRGPDNRLGEHLPAIFPGRAEQAAARRLLSNDGAAMEHILDSHFEQTVERCRAERLVLAVQDTTTPSHDGLTGTSGLGGGGRGSSGILARAGVAANAAGRPLGMFEADADFRQAEGKDSVRWTDGLDRAQELARACPDTRVISVCDREGDFRDLISRAQQTGAALPGRAGRGSKRRVALASGGDADLWDHVLGTEPAGGRRIEVPACGGPNRRKARTARLTLRCTPADLLPPKDRAGEAPVRMIAVSAREENPPRRLATGKRKKRNGPLHWMLPATEGEAGLDAACTALRRHGLRWRIERFFHALKTGTRIEDRRLDEAGDLRKCLAFDAVTAFRVRDLSLLARERPDDPASRHVAGDDFRALRALAARHGFKVPGNRRR